MVIKIMETGHVERLTYRTWDGIKYGQDEAEDIVRQYMSVPYDRGQQAFIMSRKDFNFWRQYFKHLEWDEKQIRGLYEKYHVTDVESILKEELRIAGDDPARHHDARRKAIAAIKESATKKNKSGRKEYLYDDYLSIRFSSADDLDLIAVLRSAEQSRTPKTHVVKRLMRLGIEYEKKREQDLQNDVNTLRAKGWL